MLRPDFGNGTELASIERFYSEFTSLEEGHQVLMEMFDEEKRQITQFRDKWSSILGEHDAMGAALSFARAEMAMRESLQLTWEHVRLPSVVMPQSFWIGRDPACDHDEQALERVIGTVMLWRPAVDDRDDDVEDVV